MRRVFFVCAVYLIASLVSTSVEAGTTFLPDYLGSDIEADHFDGDVNVDAPLCAEAVSDSGVPLYHKASTCPEPKIFDEYCPFDNEWISECYCPEIFSQNCPHPYRGDIRVKDPDSGYSSCDGWYVECCDTTCPSGTTEYDPGGCGDYTYNDCGDICYYPYVPCCTPYSDETGCTCGTYTCDDGCGNTRSCCSSCPEPEPEPDVDPCDGVSCPTAKSCEYGCAEYSSETDCCSSVCIECKACSYSTTASECSSQCKNTGSNSCSINGTTYYDSCGSSLCSSGQVCYNGNCCTPDDFEWPEPACGCDGWAEEDIGCGLTVSYCRKPAQCSGGLLTGCDGVAMECGGKYCCCPTGRCYDEQGQNMCDCASDMDK